MSTSSAHDMEMHVQYNRLFSPVFLVQLGSGLVMGCQDSALSLNETGLPCAFAPGGG